MNFYQEYNSENKAEFYAYNLLFLVYNYMDFEQIMHLIPFELFEEIVLKNALKLVSSLRNEDYYQYFSLIRKEPNYLLACVASFHINNMRKVAMKLILSRGE